MKKKLLLGSITLSLLMAFSACRKEQEDLKVGGCSDENSPLYSSSIDYDDNSCRLAYVTSYEISYHPETDGSEDWDLWTNTDADLIFRIKKASEANWFFESSEIANQPHDVAAIWSAPTEFQLLNEDYEWELVDYDATSSDDLVASGTFNPIESAEDGFSTTKVLNASANETQLRLHYQLKK